MLRSLLTSILESEPWKPAPAIHAAVVGMGQVEHAADIARRGKGLRAVERNRERHRNAFPAEIGGHLHDGVGAERMSDDDDRPFGAGVIGGRGVVGERLPLRIVVHCRIDAAALNLLRERIHARARRCSSARAAGKRARATAPCPDRSEAGHHQAQTAPRSPLIAAYFSCVRLLASGPGAHRGVRFFLAGILRNRARTASAIVRIFPPEMRLVAQRTRTCSKNATLRSARQ